MRRERLCRLRFCRRRGTNGDDHSSAKEDLSPKSSVDASNVDTSVLTVVVEIVESSMALDGRWFCYEGLVKFQLGSPVRKCQGFFRFERCDGMILSKFEIGSSGNVVEVSFVPRRTDEWGNSQA